MNLSPFCQKTFHFSTIHCYCMLSWMSLKRLSSSVHPICLLNLFLTYSIWGYQHVHECLKAPRWRCSYKIGLETTKTYMTVTNVPIIILRIQSCNATPLMWEVLNYSTWIKLTRKSHKPAENKKVQNKKKISTKSGRRN